MKLQLLSLLLIYLTCQIEGDNKEVYTTKYDNVNLNEVLNSERLLNGYINCLLDLGPCTPDGMELKKNLPNAIENDCNKCTEKQRDGANKVMHFIIDNRPYDWEKLEIKYNSNGDYKAKYLETKTLNINITEEMMCENNNISIDPIEESPEEEEKH